MDDIDHLHRKNHELLILNQIAASLNKAVDLSETLQTALENVAALCNLETGWIWLLDEETEMPYLAAERSLPRVLRERYELMEGSRYCHCLDTYQRDDITGAANISVITCTRLKGIIEDVEGLRYHSTIPLYAQGKKLGVLNVASTEWHELSPDELRILHTIGDFLSIAIERARLFNRSTQLGIIEERNRLAREIHDTLAQGLTAIILQLETADALLESRDNAADVRGLLQKTLGLTRANLEEARRSVLDLRAAPLEGRSLSEALGELAAAFEAQQSAHITISANEQRSLPSHMEVGLFRITQEVLNNIAQHAKAQNIVMNLRMTPEQVELAIEDDGQGFDTNAPLDGHHGIIGINERAKMMGGTMRFFSTPGQGTRIEVRVPLPH